MSHCFPTHKSFFTSAAGIVVACSLIAGFVQDAPGQDNHLAEASRLRNEASDAWKHGEYEQAAKLLKQADKIYVRDPGKHLSERAIVLRALTWNSTLFGDVEQALQAFEALVEMGAGSEPTHVEIGEAAKALWTSTKTENRDYARESCEEILKDAGLEEVFDRLVYLERATKLREDSTVDWKEKRYHQAADKLKAADDIYARLPGEYLADRAIVLRALVFNLGKARQEDNARAAFETMIDVIGPHSKHHDEVSRACQGISDLAMTLGLKRARTLLSTCRKNLERQGLSQFAERMTRFEADRLVAEGETKRATKIYERCLKAQQRLSDHEGYVQTANNLSALHLEARKAVDALGILKEAYQKTRAGEAPNGQAAVAQNIRRALNMLIKKGRASSKAMTEIEGIVRIALNSESPEAVPTDYLLRLYAKLMVGNDKRKGHWRAAQMLRSVQLRNAPPEVTVDLRLRAARLAVKASESATAKEWLQSLEIPSGQTAPHLHARRDLLLAECAAHEDDAGLFERHATLATDAFAKMKDIGALKNALNTLIGSGRDVAPPAYLAALEKRLASVKKNPGGLGGSGGTAISTKRRDDLDRMGPLDKIFSVSAEHWKPAEWRAKGISLNGISYRRFGGYFVFHSTIPSSSSVALGSPGTLSLDELGPYLPVPSQGVYHLLKNGAVRYVANSQ